MPFRAFCKVSQKKKTSAGTTEIFRIIHHRFSTYDSSACFLCNHFNTLTYTYFESSKSLHNQGITSQQCISPLNSCRLFRNLCNIIFPIYSFLHKNHFGIFQTSHRHIIPKIPADIRYFLRLLQGYMQHLKLICVT